jgi:hypothetical protein
MVGGFFGGPAGAAAGAYAGNMAGRMSTGQKLGGSNPAWRAAAPNALYGGLGYLGAGYLAGAGGAAGAGAGAAPIFNGAVSSAPGMTTAATPYISGAAAGTGSGLGAAAGAAAPSMLSTYGLPAALIGGGMLMNKKGEKQREAENERHYQDDKERRDEVNRRALGKYDTPYTISPRHNSFNPNEYSRINYDEPRNYYKKGGKVVGVEIVGRGPSLRIAGYGMQQQ